MSGAANGSGVNAVYDFWLGLLPHFFAQFGAPYAMRLKRLKARGVGLWDVIESAERSGSLDSAIRGAELRDLATFVARLPALEAIAFNGKTAATQGRQQLGARANLTLIDLPSSSGAYASLSREKKALAWQALRPWVAA